MSLSVVPTGAPATAQGKFNNYMCNYVNMPFINRMETVTLNRTVYFQDYDCCPGYGGQECLRKH